MLNESVGTKAEDGSPLLYDCVDASAAAVGHVDIDVVCTGRWLGSGQLRRRLAGSADGQLLER